MLETSITAGMSKSDALVQAHYFRALRIKGDHFSKLGVRYRGGRSYLPNRHPYRAEGWAGLTACDDLATEYQVEFGCSHRGICSSPRCNPAGEESQD